MAEKTTAKIVITAEGDKAVSAAKKVQKELKATGSAGKKAGADVDAGADKGAAGLKKMDSSAGKAEGALTTLSVSVLGLGASITGLSDAILGFNEKTVALERSTFGLKEMTIQVQREQEDLTKAIQEGTMSAEEQKRAVEDLGLSMEALAIEERTVKAEAEALSGEWVSFAVNTGTTVVQSILAISSMLALKTAASATATGATAAHTGANWGLVASLKAAAAAMKAFMLSNPVTAAALIASTAAVAAYETNLGGMRDGIEDLMGMERGSLPTLTGGFMELTGATNESADAAVDWAARAEEIANQARTGLVPQIDSATESMGNLGGEMKLVSHEADATTGKIQTLADALDRLKKKRALNIIEDSEIDGLGIALSAVADAEKKIRDAVGAKGLIDQSMMDALIQAEEAGIIKKGTAGQYRAVVERTGGSGRSDNPFFNNLTYGGYSTIQLGALSKMFGNKSAGLILAARNSGQFKRASSVATGSRNRTSQKFAYLRSLHGTEAFRIGKLFGLERTGGFSNLSSAFRNASSTMKAGQGIIDLFARVGMKIPEYRERRFYHSGMSQNGLGARILARDRANYQAGLQRMLAAANAEVNAFNSLIAFNPNFANLNLAGAGIDANYLTNKLATEQERIGGLISKYNFDKSQIISLESTQQGTVVLNGMMDFRERMGLISGGIV